MINDWYSYYFFFLYVAINLVTAAVCLRPSVKAMALYMVSVLLLFWSYFFTDWSVIRIITLLHIAALAYAIFKTGRWLLLPFTLCNLFMWMAFGRTGALHLEWFLADEMELPVLNVMSSLNVTAVAFLMFILAPIIIVKLCRYAYKRYKKQPTA